jgi:multiple antibiotic resistance protein
VSAGANHHRDIRGIALNEFFKTALLIVTALFPLINPPAVALVVMSMVSRATKQELATLARRISVNSFVILLSSLSIGAYVLAFFGISVPVLRVAGGFVIVAAGWKLLQSPADEEAEQEALPDRSATLRARAFYPLTLPMTVGPGAIAVAIALGTGTPRDGLELKHLLGVGFALVFLCVCIYLCVRFAAYIENLLGTVGTQVAMRLFAFVLFCIGVQILWLGLSELLMSLHLH